MGTMANDLSLGCDCVGQIHYLVSTTLADGFPVRIWYNDLQYSLAPTLVTMEARLL